MLRQQIEQAVAPFMGAWIEMVAEYPVVRRFVDVAPFMGAWIEMREGIEKAKAMLGRTLHGCVD